MIPQAFLDQYGMIIAIILFALTYVLMLTFSKVRPYIALGSAVLFIATGMLPLSEIWGTGLDMSSLNVLLMIAGTMGLVALFIESKMPELLADLVLSCCPNVMVAAVALSLFAGIISAFVDNVATVLMIAPVALEICKKLKTNPVPFIIAIAVSSNLQGAATLVGDTTAIMLGSALNMSFLDFFWYNGRPGMFFVVELGAILSALLLAFLVSRLPPIFISKALAPFNSVVGQSKNNKSTGRTSLFFSTRKSNTSCETPLNTYVNLFNAVERALIFNTLLIFFSVEFLLIYTY